MEKAPLEIEVIKSRNNRRSREIILYVALQGDTSRNFHFATGILDSDPHQKNSACLLVSGHCFDCCSPHKLHAMYAKPLHPSKDMIAKRVFETTRALNHSGVF